MPAGQPSKFSEEIAAEICTRIAGGESLRSVCESAHIPPASTVLGWVTSGLHPEFERGYRLSRECQGYFYADQMLDAANGALSGDIPPQAAKAAMDGFKWIAERNAARIYGPKQEIQHTGHLVQSPSRIELVAPPIESLTDAELEAIARSDN